MRDDAYLGEPILLQLLAEAVSARTSVFWLLLLTAALVACGGKEDGDDAGYDGPYSCVDEPSKAEARCTFTSDPDTASLLCSEVDASVSAGPCPTGYSACCIYPTATHCYYPPTWIDAAAKNCADFDGSFVRYDP